MMQPDGGLPRRSPGSVGFSIPGLFLSAARSRFDRVPTLFRFIATLAILGGLAFAGLFALATFVVPTPREMSVMIPASKLQPPNR